MFSKLLFLGAALVSATIVDFANPIAAQAQSLNNSSPTPASPCRPSQRSCQSVPTPAMLPALLVLGGGMMLYNQRKKES